MSGDGLLGGIIGGGQRVVDSVARNRVSQLISALTVSAGGYTFLQNPQGFILFTFWQAFVGFLDAAAGAVAFEANQMWYQFAGIVVGGIRGALGPVGDMAANLLLDAVLGLNSVVVGLAASAGPFGLPVAIGGWAVVFGLVIYGIAGAWRLYKWIRTVVV